MTSSRARAVRTIVAASALSVLGACGHKNNQEAGGDVASYPSATPTATAPATTTSPASMDADTMTAPHHSKLGGALVGAAAGHMLGGHAVAGAAVGALVQHERNKHRK